MNKHIDLIDPSGVYAIGRDGDRVWIPTPFNALCMVQSGKIEINHSVCVENTAKDRFGDVYYIINGYAHPSICFLVDFETQY